MAVAAVLSVLCAALIAMGAAKLGHHAARSRKVPDVGPVQDPAVARMGDYAKAGPLIDLCTTEDRMPGPAKAEVRGHSGKYAHMVIDREWPRTCEGGTGEETRAMARGLCQLAAKVPAQTPPKAVDDARDALDRLLAQRRLRVADIEGGLPRCAARRS
ncbi:hypothetical protein [Streptomyces sp. NPDC059957]|uniref:bestrophin-like domain n=1 Tax=unclassified Streptomyces TaxID=2593676 RepID=UPI00365A149F